jgi:hypothetical protein
MGSVPEKDVYTEGQREKAGYREYRDGCDDAMPEFDFHQAALRTVTTGTCARSTTASATLPSKS